MAQAFTLQQTYYDHLLTGGADSSGNINQVWGNDALKNAILLWMSLYQGEILRSPNLGGYLTRLLMKPMSDSRARLIESELKRSLQVDFDLQLQNISVQATPNYSTRNWTINLSAYSPDIRDTLSLQVLIKNISN